MSTGPQPPREPSGEEPQASEQLGAAGATSATSEAQGESAKSPEELQRDIEQTRQDLGDTVDALAQKADVKAQLKDAADEQKAKLRAKGEEVKQKVTSAGGDGGGGGQAGQRAKQLSDEVASRTRRQPLPYLGGAFAAGVFFGLVLRGRRS
jgi:ElaB/YqjD/DUF883 family membrane-anchored ribosome-binding protein